MTKPIEVFNKFADVELRLVIRYLLETDRHKLLQLACNKLNSGLVVDGIVGNNTFTAILRLVKEDLLNTIEELLNDVPKEATSSLKDKLLKYLSVAEGTVIHWNKGETSYTTPYGIYKKSFPRSKVIQYVNSLFVKYNLKENRQNAKLINKYLTTEEKTKIRDLAYELLVSVFIHEGVKATLEFKEFDKSFLTFFSLNVNGGPKRGAKALQTALGVTVDGSIGSQTIIRLKNYNGTDENLNLSMLKYMKKFYDSLIRRKPKKYLRFKNGWYNRLRKLGYKDL